MITLWELYELALEATISASEWLGLFSAAGILKTKLRFHTRLKIFTEPSPTSAAGAERYYAVNMVSIFFRSKI